MSIVAEKDEEDGIVNVASVNNNLEKQAQTTESDIKIQDE